MLWIAQYLSSADGAFEQRMVCASADLAFGNITRSFYIFIIDVIRCECAQKEYVCCCVYRAEDDQIRIGVLCRIRGIDAKVILKSILDFSNTLPDERQTQQHKCQQQQHGKNWNSTYSDRVVFRKPLLLTDFNILSNIVLHYYFPFTMSPSSLFHACTLKCKFRLPLASIRSMCVCVEALCMWYKCVSMCGTLCTLNPLQWRNKPIQIDSSAWEFIKQNWKSFYQRIRLDSVLSISFAFFSSIFIAHCTTIHKTKICGRNSFFIRK